MQNRSRSRALMALLQKVVHYMKFLHISIYKCKSLEILKDYMPISLLEFIYTCAAAVKHRAIQFEDCQYWNSILI